MRITYDPLAQAVYIYLFQNEWVFHTDRDKQGDIAGIEILNVTKVPMPELIGRNTETGN